MRISAIVPAFNAAHCIDRAVGSLLGTGYPDLEIVVVDDGSTDATLAVARDLQRKNPEVIFVYQHPRGANRGVSASRNLGIRKSTGELLVFLDADDYVYLHRFDAVAAILGEDDTVDGVHDVVQVVFADESAEAKWEADAVFGLQGEVAPDALLGRLVGGDFWHTNGLTCRRSLLQKTGLFNEGLRIAEDCHLWFRMACVGKIVAGQSRSPVAAYCRHDSNTFVHGLERKVDMVRAMADVCRWARSQNLSAHRREMLLRGTLDYVLNAVVVAREAGLPWLAWRIITTTAFGGCPAVLADRRQFRQVAHIWKEILWG